MYNLLEKEKQVCENKHGPFYRIASISREDIVGCVYPLNVWTKALWKTSKQNPNLVIVK